MAHGRVPLHRAAPGLSAMRIASSVLMVALAGAIASAQEHEELAAEFARQGDLKSAEAELRKALQARPDDPALLTSLGGILGMQGDLRQANPYLAKAVRLDPRNPVLRRNLAANQWQLGDVPEARANLERLLRANPQDKVAVFLLGMVLENQREYSRSATLLESVPEITTGRPEALVALASDYYHGNRRADAQNLLRRLRADTNVTLQAGKVALDAEDYSTAIAVLAGDSAEVLLLRASVEMKLEYFFQAVTSYERALKIDPQSAEAARGLATAEWRAGMRDKAAADFQDAIRRFPGDAATRQTWATLLLEEGADRDRAVELLKSVAAIDPSSAEPLYQLANAELSEGKPAQALGYLNAAMKLDSQDARIHYAMSRAYRRLGRSSDADREMRAFEKLKAARRMLER